MSAVSTAEPRWQAAIHSCRQALRRLANSTLEPVLDERLRDLGERKESLSEDEYAVLLALVSFTEQRTLEKLEAERALRQLDAVAPEPGDAP
jgi:cell division protein ZapA (FtsZ GTPase activity inhibitor)